MKVATWNVNSINVRLPQVIAWLLANQVDVLALQETKVVDELFPVDAFKEIGYTCSYTGQKTYNGVALITRDNMLDACKVNRFAQDDEKRIIAATVNGVRVVNLYVPNGQSVDSEKYHYKLSWLEAMQTFLKEELLHYPNLIVLGDFNIAPADIDVHDPALWENSVLVSKRERLAFQALLDIGLVDALRYHNKEPNVFTWWDYRQAAFRRNMGLRIDLILVSTPLLSVCQGVHIDKEARKAERPSDHAPVWVELSM